MSSKMDVQKGQLSRSKRIRASRQRKRRFTFIFFMLLLLIGLFAAVPAIQSSTMADQLIQVVKPKEKLANQEEVLASPQKTPPQKLSELGQELKTEIKVDAIQTKAEKKCTCQNEVKKKEDIHVIQREGKKKEDIRVIQREGKKKEDIRVIEHEVKKNETLFSITMLYFSSSQFQNKISSYNGITDPAKEIRSGMKLNIPNPEFMFDHKVSKGETLASISRKYYGSASYRVSLANFNGIKNPDQLKYGETVQIPGPFVLQKLSENKDKEKATGVYSIVITKKTNKLVVYQDKKAIKTFSVGTGKNSSLTPEGTYRIVNKIEKPWYSPKDIPGGDPKNPFGSHWLGLDVPGTKGTKYGIHGTNDPSSIGGYVSLGCIRLKNADVQWLFQHIPLKTVVTIK
ncbi:L,D-transpeptidase family protein [Cytobacillus solani]|uniref:L,D-transpeptidase family protein n=1 Tax=Cytobacillus solani TaxID=1637975 RepID=UPI001151F060|nr:L,D-transpeptidase family protein [Cytobacillus solani]